MDIVLTEADKCKLADEIYQTIRDNLQSWQNAREETIVKKVSERITADVTSELHDKILDEAAKKVKMDERFLLGQLRRKMSAEHMLTDAVRQVLKTDPQFRAWLKFETGLAIEHILEKTDRTIKKEAKKNGKKPDK